VPVVLIPQADFTGDPQTDRAMALAEGVPEDAEVTVSLEGEHVRLEWEA
jgi:hypothetical protein